jgi:uncharacterized protein (TIGR03083 family)
VTDKADNSESDPIIAMLVEEWAALEELLDGLDASEWWMPTTLPGWSVHDVVAHLIGTESRLSGEGEPPSLIDVTTLAHVRNAIGAANEHWVRALRSEPPEEMRLRFQDVSRRRAEMLIAMSREDFDVPTQTPVGQAPYRRFTEIRVFDCWMHEQDIRQAIGRPGHEDGPCAEVSIDEVVRALGFIIGKQAAVPDGSIVTIDLIDVPRSFLNLIGRPRPRSISLRRSLRGLPVGELTPCQALTLWTSPATLTSAAESWRTSHSRSDRRMSPFSCMKPSGTRGRTICVRPCA